jgi:hypothetical protein
VYEISQRILDMVRRELVQNPEIENGVLYQKARELDPNAMQDLDRRQFNARYPLRVKRFELLTRKPRSENHTKPRTRRRRVLGDGVGASVKSIAAPASVMRQLAREGVRDVLLRFAVDLANADSRGQIVAVVANVDQYVDQILGMGSFPE